MSEQTKVVEEERINTASETNADQTSEPVETGFEGDEAPQNELQLMLEDARSKADEHWNQVLRLQAELENSRRRTQRDVESAHKYGLEKFALALLPVIDSLEMGLAAASGEEESIAKLREGTELTLKMFDDVLVKFGLNKISPEGETFNPELHQAMAMQESAELEPNTVMMVMQKGYTLNERLIRPAMVMVSKAPV